MAKITKKVQKRLRAGVRRFRPLLKAAREREARRAATAPQALLAQDQAAPIPYEEGGPAAPSVHTFCSQAETFSAMLTLKAYVGEAAATARATEAAETTRLTELQAAL